MVLYSVEVEGLSWKWSDWIELFGPACGLSPGGGLLALCGSGKVGHLLLPLTATTTESMPPWVWWPSDYFNCTLEVLELMAGGGETPQGLVSWAGPPRCLGQRRPVAAKIGLMLASVDMGWLMYSGCSEGSWKTFQSEQVIERDVCLAVQMYLCALAWNYWPPWSSWNIGLHQVTVPRQWNIRPYQGKGPSINQWGWGLSGACAGYAMDTLLANCSDNISWHGWGGWCM